MDDKRIWGVELSTGEVVTINVFVCWDGARVSVFKVGRCHDRNLTSEEIGDITSFINQDTERKVELEEERREKIQRLKDQ